MPLERSTHSPAATATAAAGRAAPKLTAATTAALAASTRPRRGLAANVARIRPRRYSAVVNMVATTATAISPKSTPSRVRPIGVPVPSGPAATSGAMSPVPVTVTVPPA